MADLPQNIAICVFCFFDTKRGFNLLNTTDVKALKNELHYSGDRDDELYVGRNILLKYEGKERAYNITSIGVHYYQGDRDRNRTLVGDKSDYNVQIMVWVEELE